MINKKAQVTGKDVLVVLFVLALGFVGGYFVAQNSYEKYETAVNELIPPISDEVYAFSGEVISISGESFVVRTTSLDRQLPGSETKFREINVNTNSETSFYELDITSIPSNPEEEFPNPEISFSDLEVGIRVSVDSSENVLFSNEVTASEVTKIVEF